MRDSAVRRPKARALAVLTALLAGGLAAGCSGDDDQAPAPTQAPSATAAVPTKAAAPKPSVSTSPPPKPVPMGTAAAFLKALPADEPTVNADPQTGCFDAYPELLDVSCDTLQLDGGTVLWLAGSEDAGAGQRRRALRLLTFDTASGGYRPRFLSRDPSGGWTGFAIGPARLTGNGVDGLVVQTRLAGNGGSYDVLTWRAGGPLILRGHRPPARDLTVVAREERLDDYQVSEDPKRYRYRRIVWNGAELTIADFGLVPAREVPRA